MLIWGGKFGYEPVFTTFPGGEEHVRIRTDVNVYEIYGVNITAHLGDSAALELVFLNGVLVRDESLVDIRNRLM